MVELLYLKKIGSNPKDLLIIKVMIIKPEFNINEDYNSDVGVMIRIKNSKRTDEDGNYSKINIGLYGYHLKDNEYKAYIRKRIISFSQE